MPPALETTFSSTGPNCLQGPHQGAQKSTITGAVIEASMTSAMKVWSVASFTTPGALAAISISLPRFRDGFRNMAAERPGGNPRARRALTGRRRVTRLRAVSP